MCEELERAIDISESLGKKLPKQLGIFAKGTLAALKKQDSDIKALSAQVQKNHETRDKKLDTLTKEMKEVKTTLKTFQADAVKWRLVIDVFQFLFGDVKRSFLTLIWVSVIFGGLHLTELIELAKALV